MKDCTRREFIRLATVMGGASLFAGCTFLGEGPRVPEYIRGAPGVDPLETLSGTEIIYSVCALCPGNCGIGCRVAQGTLVKIGGSPFHPATADPVLSFETALDKARGVNGSICAVGGSGIQTLYDPFRVAHPLKRVGPRGSGKWKALPWDDALREIIEGGNLFGEGNITGLNAIIQAGSGLSFLAGRTDWGSLTFLRRFLAAFPGAALLRGKEVITQEIATLASDGVFGPDTGTVDANYKKARFLISFGDAPLDSGEPLVSVARDIANNRLTGPGLRWAVVDPRLSTSASKADLWIPVIPGTDRQLAIEIMKALLDRYPDSIRVPKDMVKGFIAGQYTVADARDCGITPDITIRLAERLAREGQAAAVVPGRGIFSQADGLETAKIILSLNLMIGSVPGSGGLVKRNDRFLRQVEKSLFREGSPPAAQSFPSDFLSKALFVWEADPVYDDPSAVSEQLKDRGEFPLLVVIDREITETAAFADYILPDTTYLERWDLCISPPAVNTSGFGVRRPAVGGLDPKTGTYFPVLPDTKTMEDILIGLGANLRLRGFESDNPASVKNALHYYMNAFEAAISAMTDQGLGPDLAKVDSTMVIERGGLFNNSASRSPHNAEPKKTSNFVFPVRKFDDQVTAMNEELLLISYTLPFHRSPRSVVNSWLLEVLPDNRLIINSTDARKRGITQGDRILMQEVSRGVRVQCRALVTPGIRPGVAALARGFGNRQCGAIGAVIDDITVSGEKTRGAGVNTMTLASVPGLAKVKVTKS